MVAALLIAGAKPMQLTARAMAVKRAKKPDRLVKVLHRMERLLKFSWLFVASTTPVTDVSSRIQAGGNSVAVRFVQWLTEDERSAPLLLYIGPRTTLI
ncbi:MAG: hypothetical protein HY287_14240 [Planctomycetes bacterium]|nr:hypothetical protein [Planctomycetota bacterium]